MHITITPMEVRIMELEDTVKLMAAALQTITDMLGNLNEVNKVHTGLLQALVEKLEGDDEPPWANYKG